MKRHVLVKRRRSLHRSLHRRITGVVMGALAVGGCTGGGDAPNTTVEFVPADVPAGAAQTPFCSGMSAISLRVNTDPPSDLGSFLISEYEALLPVVPPAIASEFQTVLENLREGTNSGTDAGRDTLATITTDPSDGFAEEGYLPDEEPALRLNAYLADNCFGTQSNPGPPPTEPFSDVPAPSAPSTTAPATPDN